MEIVRCAFVQATVGDAIVKFQTSSSQANYTAMGTAVQSALNNYTGAGSSLQKRIGVTIYDGSVAYYTPSGENNTWEIFQQNKIITSNYETNFST